jgi:hypothetical protein
VVNDGDFENDEDLAPDAEEECQINGEDDSDSDDDSVVGDGFPPQLVCEEEGRVCLIAWYDKKPVHLLTTLNTKKFCVARKVKDTGQGYKQIRVRAPSVLRLYNQGMGGTDLCDQNLSYYRNAMRSSKWQIRIFCHFVLLIGFNAHVLFKAHFKLTRGQRGFRLKSFLEEVARGLCGRGRGIVELTRMEVDEDTPVASTRRARDGKDEEGPVHKYMRLPQALALQSSLTDHHPQKWSSRAEVEDEEGNITIEDQRPRCKMCATKTSYSCECCKVGLCLDAPRHSALSCWKIYHSD